MAPLASVLESRSIPPTLSCVLAGNLHACVAYGVPALAWLHMDWAICCDGLFIADPLMAWYFLSMAKLKETSTPWEVVLPVPGGPCSATTWWCLLHALRLPSVAPSDCLGLVIADLRISRRYVKPTASLICTHVPLKLSSLLTTAG